MLFSTRIKVIAHDLPACVDPQSMSVLGTGEWHVNCGEDPADVQKPVIGTSSVGPHDLTAAVDSVRLGEGDAGERHINGSEGIGIGQLLMSRTLSASG